MPRQSGRARQSPTKSALLMCPRPNSKHSWPDIDRNQPSLAEIGPECDQHRPRSATARCFVKRGLNSANLPASGQIWAKTGPSRPELVNIVPQMAPKCAGTSGHMREHGARVCKRRANIAEISSTLCQSRPNSGRICVKHKQPRRGHMPESHMRGTWEVSGWLAEQITIYAL